MGQEYTQKQSENSSLGTFTQCSMSLYVFDIAFAWSLDTLQTELLLTHTSCYSLSQTFEF